MTTPASPAKIGVNGESQGTYYTNWGQPATYGQVLQGIVTLVDNSGITITVGDLSFEDRNDGLTPTSGSPNQRTQAATALQTAGISASDATTVLTNLQAALNAEDSYYDFETLGGLEGKTVNLATLIANAKGADGQWLTGDALIEAFLTSMGLPTHEPAYGYARPLAEVLADLPSPSLSDDLPDESSPAPTQAAAPVSTGNLTQFLGLMGIQFVDTNGNGEVDWDDLKAVAGLDADGNGEISLAELKDYAESKHITILEDFFKAMANNMKVGGSDDKITLEELQRAVEVIGRYAAILGLSFEDAAKLYFSSSLENKDFTALEAAGASISRALADNNHTTFANAEEVRATLTELGYNSEIINNVIALIDFTNQATAQFVIACIMRVVVSSYPAGQPLTQEKILAWLCGEALIDDSQITGNDAFNGIFLVCASSREPGSGLRAATAYINDQLIASGQLELAERAVELIMQRARESGAEDLQSPYHELLSLPSNPQLLESFAQGYIGAGRYEDALAVALRMGAGQQRDSVLRQIAEGFRTAGNYQAAFNAAKLIGDASARDQVVQPLFEFCVSNTDPILLGLAFDIAKWWGVDRQADNLARVALAFANCTASDAARQRAHEVIAFMTNPTAGDPPGLGLAGTANLNAQEIRDTHNGQSIRLDVFEKEIAEQLNMPFDVFVARASVLPPGSRDPQLADAATAVQKLQDIISAHPGTTVEDLRIRAHALMALAEILKAQADALWNEGITGNPANSDAFKLYELMARVARAAYDTFQQLSGTEGVTTEDRIYYNKMAISSNSLIAQVIYSNCGLWAGKEWSQVPGHMPNRIDNYVQYRSAFQRLAKYIPAGSTVAVTAQPGAQAQEYKAKQFKLFAELNGDDVHSNSYLTSHGYPSDILAQFCELADVPLPAAAGSGASGEIASETGGASDVATGTSIETPPAPPAPTPLTPHQSLVRAGKRMTKIEQQLASWPTSQEGIDDAKAVVLANLEDAFDLLTAAAAGGQAVHDAWHTYDILVGKLLGRGVTVPANLNPRSVAATTPVPAPAPAPAQPAPPAQPVITDADADGDGIPDELQPPPVTPALPTAPPAIPPVSPAPDPGVDDIYGGVH